MEQETRTPKGKRRVKRRSDAVGEGKAVQRKRKRKPQLVEQDLSQLPPEEGVCYSTKRRVVDC